jgi:hypothetical protein
MTRGLIISVVFSVATTVGAATNLVVNGGFDDSRGLAHGWKTQFAGPGESWYEKNHELVSVSAGDDKDQRHLRLNVATQFLADFPGVKSDSVPIPFDPGKAYRFSARSRSTGPDCRVMLEGYHWKPGVDPYDNPSMRDLRRCYRFKPLYFGAVKGGTTGSAGAAWSEASQVVSAKDLSTEAQKSFGKIQFVIVHIVGITGKAGDVYVDDVRLEPVE